MVWLWVALGVMVLLASGLAAALVQTRRVGREQARLEEDVAHRREAALDRREAELASREQEVADQRQRDEQERQELAKARQQADRDRSELRDRTDQAASSAASAESRRSELERRLAEVQQRTELEEERIRLEQADLRQLRSTLETREQRLGEREDRALAESHDIQARLDEIAESQEQVQADRERAAEELQRVAGLDQVQARAEVIAQAEHEARLEATTLARDIERKARQQADSRARGIIVTAIQRLASEQTSESVVSTLDLPSDEMKGRIIGREGRNIRHFEQVTGVNVMIDDTPGSVLLSCFDPVRRETARLTLAELVADGRIHPARIEEVHERSTERIHERILRAAEDALAEVGISDIDPALLPTIGALRYRTSYGQNVLRHLVECGHLAGMMAAELGLDVATCTRAAFLHDIGKALSHEVEGTHAMVGAELARRHGESPEIVHAIAAHHNEVEPTTVEAVLTQACDAISGSRPGARRESLEAYVKRLDRLEQIAASHDGVERVFAMQAGREVRVMVLPEVVDDASAHQLARQIAHEVQEELTYPGQIRVTVVRESRATEIAH
ncbi:ribonuclease Y [Luteococcus sp.]|uniref:ribonuclease Y n=1 Tax=Luteococcus sp. TaxID=1969402 RepID=UPI003736FBBE